jgi:anti-sigma-K factor RskA
MDAAGDGSAKRSWRSILAISAVVALVVAMLAVFLVLTGIIAEPETVIEAVIRALSGR